MKRTVQIIALVLVAAMLASSLSVAAFADETNPLEKYKTGTGYVAIGDSYARGYGASANWENEIYRMDNTNDPNCRIVNGSYPYLVAQALGLNAPENIKDKTAQYWPIAQNAVSTAFINDLIGLEDGFCDTDFTYSDWSLTNRYKTDLAYFGDPLSYAFGGEGLYGNTGSVMSIRDLIKNASLISVGLGQCDVIYRTQWLYFDTIDFSDTEALPGKITTLVEELYAGYDRWKGLYKVFMDYLKDAVNEDATVVLLGALNPIQDLTVSEDYLVPIGSAISIIMDLMNKYTRQCAQDYGFIFIDISDVETPLSGKDISLGEFFTLSGYEQGLDTHPSPEGYAEIAGMIVTALRDKAAADAAAKTTVRINVGSKQVSYVLLNGKRTTDYTVSEDGVLSINCGNTTSESLTVATIEEDSSVKLSVYRLSYNDGYVVRRLYNSNDVLGSISTTLSSVGNALKKALSSLFGKK